MSNSSHAQSTSRGQGLDDRGRPTYVAPEIKVLGSLEDITAGNTGAVADITIAGSL